MQDQRPPAKRRPLPGGSAALMLVAYSCVAMAFFVVGVAGGEGGDGLPRFDDDGGGAGEGEESGRRQAGAGIAPENTRGVVIGETFFPGTTGFEWPTPLDADIKRLNQFSGKDAITDWEKTSWSQIDCCQYLNNDLIWEDAETGVPDCFCRDVLSTSWYKSIGFCALQQACENALRDFNKVFGEGKMVRGQGVEWHTESPLRHCVAEDPFRGAKPKLCGVDNTNPSVSWKDDLGRDNVRYVDVIAPEEYGTIKTFRNLNIQNRWHWTPGDVPEDKQSWHGFTAGDNSVSEGLMASTDVYPGGNHSQCCIDDASQECCLNSTQITWEGAEDKRQADCMFAVKRAICAYHFWECDSTWSSNVFNGVCKDTCDDVPKLCGTIPSTGEPLTLDGFTIGGFYNLGCTRKTRVQVKDCTNASGMLAPPTFLLRGMALISFGIMAMVSSEGALLRGA